MRLRDLKERDTRILDLEAAMKVIGRIVVDRTLKPAAQRERILAVLSLYDCQPVPQTPEGPK